MFINTASVHSAYCFKKMVKKGSLSTIQKTVKYRLFTIQLYNANINILNLRFAMM